MTLKNCYNSFYFYFLNLLEDCPSAKPNDITCYLLQ